MSHRFVEMTTTPAVRAARERYGSVVRRDRAADAPDPTTAPADALGPAEAAFIGDRDGFYIASVSEAGWPYVQYRGGPRGFLRVLGPRSLGFADLRGNRQYVTTGNVAADDRVALFLMDYAQQQRLKILARARIVDAREDAPLAASLAMPGYPGRVERAVLLGVEAFDWNCPQHITPRFTQAELASTIGPMQQRLDALREENARLRRLLAAGAKAPVPG